MSHSNNSEGFIIKIIATFLSDTVKNCLTVALAKFIGIIMATLDIKVKKVFSSVKVSLNRSTK